MKVKETIYIIAALFCASAPLTRAHCDQTCDLNLNTLFGTFFNFVSPGMENTAIGNSALARNVTGGDRNTAAGFEAMSGPDDEFGSPGSDNTAIGYEALLSYTTANNNTAVGSQALYGDPINFSTGSDNTGIGYQALYGFTTGSNNTATGRQALRNNSTGSNNTATGRGALRSCERDVGQ